MGRIPFRKVIHGQGLITLLAAAMVIAGCGSDGGPNTSGASTELSRFQGRTFAFDYPSNWRVWEHSDTNDKELVILANFPPELPGHEGLPAGAIKIDISSTDDLATKVESPTQEGQLLNFPPSEIKYFLHRTEEPTWTIQGVVREMARLYIIGVFMETGEQPALDAVRPVLSSLRLTAR